MDGFKSYQTDRKHIKNSDNKSKMKNSIIYEYNIYVMKRKEETNSKLNKKAFHHNCSIVPYLPYVLFQLSGGALSRTTFDIINMTFVHGPNPSE